MCIDANYIPPHTTEQYSILNIYDWLCACAANERSCTRSCTNPKSHSHVQQHITFEFANEILALNMRLIHSSLILRSNFCLKAVIKTKAWYGAVETSPSLPLRLHTDVSKHPSRQTWSLESPAEIRMPREQAVYQNAFSGPHPSETASGSEDTSVLKTFIHTHPHPHGLIIRFYCRDLTYLQQSVVRHPLHHAASAPTTGEYSLLSGFIYAVTTKEKTLRKVCMCLDKYIHKD